MGGIQLQTNIFALGTVGASAVELTENVDFPTSSEIEVYLKIIIQIIIGIATLMSMISARSQKNNINSK